MDSAGAVYRVIVPDTCPTCGGQTQAVYYRIKGLVPWVYCHDHGFVRGVTRDEHRKHMMTVKKEEPK